VDLVNEEDVTFLQISQNRGDVGLTLQRRTGRGADRDAHLAGDDARQCRLAQAGRSHQQHVVKRLAAPLRRLDEDRQLIPDAVLPDEIVEAARPEGDFQLLFLQPHLRV